MSALYPQNTALVAPGRMLAAVGLAQPGAGWIDTVLVLEHAFQNQDFFAAGVGVVLDFCTRLKLYQSDGLIAEFVQRHGAQSRLAAGRPFTGIGVDRELAVVAGRELAQFHEDRAAVLNER